MSLDGAGLAFGSLSLPGPFFAWLGTTTGGVLLFLFLIRRRPRDDAPSLATFVIEGAGPIAPQTLAPPIVSPPPTDPPTSKGAEPKPRNRGKTKPSTVAAVERGGTASAFAKRPAKGVERVFISYRGVPMVASPNEIRPIVARLERGDEIEIIGSHEGHLNVRTPGGLTGWIPRVTVSDVRPPAPSGPTPGPNEAALN